MSTSRTRRALHLFERASELDTSERAAFLDRECGDDADLRSELERMLSAGDRPDFLELDRLPEPHGSPPMDGLRVGSFELLRRIGAGGMGEVYEAEQDYPRRRVALKLLRAGGWRPGATRRFRSEVELLGRLNHPGIARILEAGSHRVEDGVERPFFAMEFVDGARDLISWGRERGLRERVECFVSVCDAVQHGHQQGVVHRDLKPANVLVGSNDVPLVIDFGVARAIDADLDEATRLTGHGELVGTLRYMAPEQLSGDGGAVDTRTDVYALGLLLYQLLAGRMPYDLDRRSLTEIGRIICSATPTPLRQVDRSLPEDLGWVALRALEKEPERRYPSVSELARDLRRFLAGRPVEAGPPSGLYTLRKFAARNRIAVAASVVVCLTVVIGSVVSVLAMLRAQDENEKFRAINGVLTEMFESVRIEEGGADVRAADLLDRAAERIVEFADRPELEAELSRTLAASYSSLGDFDRGETFAGRALELASELSREGELDAAYHLGLAWLRQGRLAEARALVRGRAGNPLTEASMGLGQLDARISLAEGRPAEALRMLEELVSASREALGPEADTTMDFELDLFDALIGTERFERAEALARDLAERFERASGPTSSRTLVARTKLAVALGHRHELDEAAAIYEQLAQDFQAVHGEGHPRTLTLMNDLANVYIRRGESARALPILEEVVRAREARDGPDHRETLVARDNLAAALANLDGEQAEQLFRSGLDTRRRVWGEEHPHALESQFKLARYLRQARRFEEAEPLLIDLWERAQRVFFDDDVELHRAAAELAMLHLQTGGFESSADLFELAWRGYQRRLGEDDATALVIGTNLASAFTALERWDEAVRTYTGVLAGMRRSLAASDPRLLSTLNNLAIAHARRGETARSIELFEESVRWADQHLEADHHKRLDAHENLGFSLLEDGRPEEALEHYEQAVDGLDLNVSVPDNEHSSWRLGYARCLRAAGHFEESIEELERVLEMERARLGDGHEAWFDGLRAELAETQRDRTAAPLE